MERIVKEEKKNERNIKRDGAIMDKIIITKRKSQLTRDIREE